MRAKNVVGVFLGDEGGQKLVIDCSFKLVATGAIWMEKFQEKYRMTKKNTSCI